MSFTVSLTVSLTSDSTHRERVCQLFGHLAVTMRFKLAVILFEAEVDVAFWQLPLPRTPLHRQSRSNRNGDIEAGSSKSVFAFVTQV